MIKFKQIKLKCKNIFIDPKAMPFIKKAMKKYKPPKYKTPRGKE